MHRAEALIENAAESLKRSGLAISKVQPAGDFRRGNELVTDLALVAQVDTLKDGPTKLAAGELTVSLTDAKRFGVSLLLATGSEAHLRGFEAVAKTKDLKLTENGLVKGSKVIAAKTEEEIYKALGLQFIPPELREARGEIKLARARKIPSLIELQDLRGILHAHTDASDGAATLQEMASAVRGRGYEYFGVSDHSKTAHYAGGLSEEEIDAQHVEIDQLNKSYRGKFRIFKSIESDILPNGSLDYPDDVLRRFDFIVASIHGQFRMDKEAQTERILQAVRNPFVTILGHVTGRQLLRRPGYEVDLDKILKACGKYGVAVEINSDPWRRDLDWRLYQQALKYGCMLSINPTLTPLLK